MIITISRQVATNGELIGCLVAERLGLRFYNRDLVDEIARRLQVSSETLDRLDEASLNPVRSIVLEWQANINVHAYHAALRQALQQIRERGDAVVVGRGGAYLLQGPDALHVRIIGPLALRVAIYRMQHDVPATEAKRRVRQLERERAAFVRALFQQKIDDPAHYDLVVNLAALAPEIAVNVIVEAAQAKAAQPWPPEPQPLLPRHVEMMARHRRQKHSPLTGPGDYEVT